VTTGVPDQPTTTEIAGLLAWARSLSDTHSSADPTERAAYQAAKTALLARLTPHNPDTFGEDPT
jgi:hypothetical protein